MTLHLVLRPIAVDPARRDDEPAGGPLPVGVSGFAPGRKLGRRLDRIHNRRVLAGTRVSKEHS